MARVSQTKALESCFWNSRQRCATLLYWQCLMYPWPLPLILSLYGEPAKTLLRNITSCHGMTSALGSHDSDAIRSRTGSSEPVSWWSWNGMDINPARLVGIVAGTRTVSGYTPTCALYLLLCAKSSPYERDWKKTIVLFIAHIATGRRVDALSFFFLQHWTTYCPVPWASRAWKYPGSTWHDLACNNRHVSPPNQRENAQYSDGHALLGIPPLLLQYQPSAWVADLSRHVRFLMKRMEKISSCPSFTLLSPILPCPCRLEYKIEYIQYIISRRTGECSGAWLNLIHP